MSKVIYVPQGFSARLLKITKSLGINALYTDEFSSCNIIACIGKDKLVLMHVDAQTVFSKVQEEIEWIEEPKEVILIIKNHIHGGHLLKKQLLEYFKLKMPSISFKESEMGDKSDGVYLSFELKESNIHQNIQEFPMQEKPTNLIHHPYEQEFLAVQKIEQIIGKNEKYLTQQTRTKQFYIFDGLAWEPLNETELKVDISHPVTKEEMEYFSDNDPYVMICGKLGGIVEANKRNLPVLGDLKSLITPVTVHLEGYINQYNYNLLLKRNLKEMINSEHYKPVSSADRNFKKELNQLLKQENDVYGEIQQLISKYQQRMPETTFKELVIDECKTFSRHYQDRKYYADLKATNALMYENALSYSNRAIQDYQAKKYESAISIFRNIIEICTFCLLKNDPTLASAYYNYGRSLYQAERYQEAHFFLETSLLLRKTQTVPESSKQEIEKTQNACNECANKLELLAMHDNKYQPTPPDRKNNYG